MVRILFKRRNVRLPLAMALALCAALPPVAAGTVSAGAYNGYVVDADGSVWVWGANLYGQLCDGSTSHRNSAGRLPGLQGVADVSAGGSHGLARLAAGGSVQAWGLNSADSTGRGGGQLGDGTQTNRAAPVAASVGAGLTAVVAGSYHSLALQGDGQVLAWGFNQQGQLGDGSLQSRAMPATLSLPTTVRALAAGCSHSLALTTEGTVLAWGFNSTGQLGDGSNTQRTSAVAVSGLDNVQAVAAGCAHSLALKADGTVWAWGFNYEGQLGVSTGAIMQRTPVQISGLSGITAIAAGDHHNLARDAAGQVYAWGKNLYGQVGDGSNSNRFAPVALAAVAGASDIAAGQGFSVALLANGQVLSWGLNDYGQLGNGSNQNSAIPVAVRNADGSEWRRAGAVTPPPAVSTLAADADKVFAWAERSFPDFFRPANGASLDTVPGYRVRAYPESSSYLGVNTAGEPHLYYVGPLAPGEVKDLGVLALFLAQAAP